MCSLDLVVELASRRLRMLLEWRKVLPRVVEAVERVLPGAEVYVFGSCVEGRLTADSDVDVAVVVEELPRSARGRAALLDEIWRALEELGVDPLYPLEIHLVTREELELLRRGGAKIVEARRLLEEGG